MLDLESAKSAPYFIRDNREYYNNAISSKNKSLPPLEIAEQLAHFKKMEADLGIKRGMPMSIGKANRGRAQMYPTEYAKTNLKEDFAESMAMFLTNRRKLKEIVPNRERYLHNLTKMLNNKLRY